MKPPKCRSCGNEHWGSVCSTKSTAARKDVHRVLSVKATVDPKQESGNQALPVGTLPKPKMGRPRTGYIKAEYNRIYSADKRAADKLGVSVREYRASKA